MIAGTHILHCDLGSRQFEQLEYYAAAPVQTGVSLALELLQRFPEAIIIAPGALAGEQIPGASFASMVFYEPLQKHFRHTRVPGSIGPALAALHIAALVLNGTAHKNSTLLIDKNGLHFDRDSKDSRPHITATGPAFEMNHRYTRLTADRMFEIGSGGAGAAWAEKKLSVLTLHPSQEKKAAVAMHGIPAADIVRRIFASPFLTGEAGIATFGTGALIDLYHDKNLLKHTAHLPIEELNAPALKRATGMTSVGCPNCPVNCRKRGKNATLLPDFETHAYLLSFPGINTAAQLLQLHKAFMLAGLDPLSAAAIAAEQALKNLENHDIPQLLTTLDATPASALCGRPLEPFEPQGLQGSALAALLSSQGTHWDAWPARFEIIRKPAYSDRFTLAGKAALISRAEELLAAFDILGICPYYATAIGIEEAAAAASALGPEYTASGLLAAAKKTIRAKQTAATRHHAARLSIPGSYLQGQENNLTFNLQTIEAAYHAYQQLHDGAL